MHALRLLAREHPAQVQRVDEAEVEIAVAVAGVQLHGQAVAAGDGQCAQEQEVDERLLLDARDPGRALARQRRLGLGRGPRPDGEAAAVGGNALEARIARVARAADGGVVALDQIGEGEALGDQVAGHGLEPQQRCDIDAGGADLLQRQRLVRRRVAGVDHQAGRLRALAHGREPGRRVEPARGGHDGALVRRAAELVRELPDRPAVRHELRHLRRLRRQALEPRPAVLLDRLRADAQRRMHVAVDERDLRKVDHAGDSTSCAVSAPAFSPPRCSRVPPRASRGSRGTSPGRRPSRRAGSSRLLKGSRARGGGPPPRTSERRRRGRRSRSSR